MLSLLPSPPPEQARGHSTRCPPAQQCALCPATAPTGTLRLQPCSATTTFSRPLALPHCPPPWPGLWGSPLCCSFRKWGTALGGSALLLQVAWKLKPHSCAECPLALSADLPLKGTAGNRGNLGRHLPGRRQTL